MRTGRLPWSYPVLALVIFSLMTAAAYRTVSPTSGRNAFSVAAPSSAVSAAPAVVNPEPPVQIDIPALGLSAPVDSVGLNTDGTMEVPTDFSRTGWFKGLEAPGVPGTAVIVGHFDSRTGPAVFHRLRDASPGDEISVTLADGRTTQYVVERSAKFPKDQFPTIDVYGPSAEPRLRLITCGGSFDRRSRHYRDNLVVYASEKVAA